MYNINSFKYGICPFFMWLCIFFALFNLQSKAQNLGLNYPANDYVTSSPNIELCWNYNAGNLYEIEVAIDQNFNNIFFTANNINNRKINIQNLASNTSYFWRVRAISPMQSAWTNYRKFTRFLPNSLGSLGLWVRADTAVTINNGTIVTWKDMSPNQYSLTQSNAANQPTLTQNFCHNNNSVKFDGNDYFIIPNYAFGIDNTVFTVVKRNGGLTQSRFIGASGNTMEITCDQTGWAQMGSIAFYDTYNPTLLTVVRSSGNNAVYKNDSLIGSSGANLSPINNASLIIGWSTFQNPVDFLVGEIAEIIVYGTLLNDSMKEVVNRYLMDKYSNQLDLGADTIISNNFCPVTLSSPFPFQQYLWSTGETTPTINVSASGSYWLQVKDYFGRISYDTIQVQYPIFNQLTSQPICVGSQLNWNTGLSGSFSYLWQDNSTQSTLAISNAGNYYVKVTDNQGCSFYSDTISISIDNFSNIATLGSDTNMCIGNTIQIQNITSQITGYLWSNNSTNDSLVINAGGVYWVEASNVNNCIFRDTIIITIVGTAPQSVFSTANGCVGANVSFSDLSIPPPNETIAQWQWSFGDGQFSNNQNTTHSFDSAGSYLISLKIILFSGCGGVSNQLINVFKEPQLNFTAINLCDQKEAIFTNQSNLFGGNLSSIAWDFGDPADTTNSNISPAAHIYNSVGTFPVQLTLTTVEGCTDSLLKNVNIKPSPIANFTSENKCLGDSTFFQDVSQVPFPWQTISRIWEFPGGDTAVLFQPSFTFDSAGVYFVKLIVQISNGCKDTVIKPVTILNNPEVNFSSEKICLGTTTAINNESICNNCFITGSSWYINDILISDSTNLSYTFADTGQHHIRLIVINNGGCEAMFDSVINILPLPTAKFTIDAAFGSPPFIPVIQNLSENASSYLWEFGDGYNSNEEIPLHTYNDTGNYFLTLKAFNSDQCFTSFTEDIILFRKKVDLMLFNLDVALKSDFIETEMLLLNNGTSIIKSFDAIVQNYNNIVTKEAFNFRLLPGEFKRIPLKTGIKQDTGINQSDVICIYLTNIDAGPDEVDQNNKLCEVISKEKFQIIRIFPIPTNDIININLLSPIEGMIKVTINEIAGNLVSELLINVTKGFNSTGIPIFDLSSGMYMISLNLNGEVINAKILKSGN